MIAILSAIANHPNFPYAINCSTNEYYVYFLDTRSRSASKADRVYSFEILNATASATLIPSMPADKIPPAYPAPSPAG